ncbi:MAG: YraN family protein [Clostridia bacterium]|nr:YraN family protein [Clostridia bacterium]
MNTHAIGVVGEDLACKYLCKKGYKILERNFSCKYGEIDVIAQQRGYYVFIEVKSRSSLMYGAPCEAVTPYKQRRIISAAKYWLTVNHKVGSPVRFDVVEVLEGTPSIIADAFRL